MLIKNIYIRLVTNVILIAIGLVSSILIVRTFGIEVIGHIAYYYSLAGVFSLFTDLGVTTAYNKFLASEEKPEDIITYLLLKFFLIAIYVLIFFSAYFLKFSKSDVDSKLLFILFACVVFDLIAQVFTATFVGRRDFLSLSKLEIASSVLLFVYNLVVCLLIKSKYFLAANRVIFSLAIIVGGLLYFYRNKLLKPIRPRRSDIKKYVNYSLPMAFSSAVSLFTNHIDKLLLGRFIGMSELGLYQIASICYSKFDRFVKPVTSTMFTEIVHRIASVPSFFHKRFRDLVQILSFSGGVLALSLLFLSTPLITCFYGAENVRSAFILKFFALALLAKSFWRPYNHVIFAIEKHKLILYLEPLSLIVTVACYYFLIPLRIGDFHLGAAALPLTEFIIWFFPAGLLRIWILKKQYGNLHMLETFLKIWLPLAVLVVIGHLFKYSAFVFSITFVVFFIAGYYFNVLTKDRCSELLKPFKAFRATRLKL